MTESAAPPAHEGGVVARTPAPRTRRVIAADLTSLGLEPGSTVLLHSSLGALGWVAGGTVAVVQALLDVLGPDGTLVVPSQTGDNSDPAGWGNPPVPADWWPVFRDETPAYDPALTPSRGMGRIAEQVRTWPGARRSDHPQNSFAAVGARAAEVTRGQPLADSLGEGSPLRILEDLGAHVLFLGTGWDTCTALHLAEYRVDDPPRATLGAALLDSDGNRAWVEFDDVDLDESVFETIGADFEKDHPELVTSGSVGSATCRLFLLADAVAYAVSWLSARRHEVDAPG